MRNKLAAILVCATLCVGPSQAGAVDLTLEDACGGAGFGGKLEAGSREASFETCTTDAGVVSRISDGEVVTEVVIDEALDRITIRIGGQLYDPTTATRDEWMALRNTLLRSRASDLVQEQLWPELSAVGRGANTPEMAALGIQAMIYEHFTPDESHGPGCVGCCGPSCWGCTGCYTNACLAHDVACGVSPRKHSQPTCQVLFAAAITSMACCGGADLGSLC